MNNKARMFCATTGLLLFFGFFVKADILVTSSPQGRLQVNNQFGYERKMDFDYVCLYEVENAGDTPIFVREATTIELRDQRGHRIEALSNSKSFFPEKLAPGEKGFGEVRIRMERSSDYHIKYHIKECRLRVIATPVDEVEPHFPIQNVSCRIIPPEEPGGSTILRAEVTVKNPYAVVPKKIMLAIGIRDEEGRLIATFIRGITDDAILSSETMYLHCDFEAYGWFDGRDSIQFNKELKDPLVVVYEAIKD